MDHDNIPSQVNKNLSFHPHLNNKLWVGTRLRPEVRVKMLQAVLSFYKFLDVPGLRLKDVLITGSNAAYNYTETSDIDIHLVVDFDKSICPKLADTFFNAKKNLWNSMHEITIRGHEVEMYVEDSQHPAYSNGVFSLTKNTWIARPVPRRPAFDDAAVMRKTEVYASRIDDILSDEPDEDQIEAMLNKLRTMRQQGLATGGEFSVENLTFKALRSMGYLDMLRLARISAMDKAMSLEGIEDPSE